MKKQSIIRVGLVDQWIFSVRGLKVMIDRDLAELYGVETKYLNRQVKRNADRFPSEFMFPLTEKEKDKLVTNWHRFASLKHSSVLPNAFTEYGVAMLAAVLNSERAVQMSILIIKAFIRLREILTHHKSLSHKLRFLETRIDKHDKVIHGIIETIRHMLVPPEKPKRPIGFRLQEPKARYVTRSKPERHGSRLVGNLG